MRGRKIFYLDKTNGKFLGVCAGIANHFGWDVTIVRVGAVVLTLVGGFPWTLIAYGVAAWMGKPEHHDLRDEVSIRPVRSSTHDVRVTMRDIDRRMAEVESYVVNNNHRLAREIEELR